ncbi:unnamed protein product [Clavelina lepadiformis]
MSCDPTSSDFDPMLALYSDEAPDKLESTATVYDNIAVFEASLKRKDKNDPKKKPSRAEKSFSQRKKIAAEVQNRDLSKLKEMMERRKRNDKESKGIDGEKEVTPTMPKKKKKLSNIFIIMEKLAVGPMSLLYKITKEHLRCHVYTRNFAGLRGILIGFVVAFDRYMNLAMVDVDETFALSPSGKVVDHQKKITIAQLTKAVEDVKLHGVSETYKDAVTSNYRHGATTGVAFTKPSHKVVDAAKDHHHNSRSNDSRTNCLVKRFNALKPPNSLQRKFSGGEAELYHRHINHLYVRGDSIVLISLPP